MDVRGISFANETFLVLPLIRLDTAVSRDAPIGANKFLAIVT